MKAIILEDNISDTWDYEMILDNLGVQVQGIYKSWKDALPELKKDLPDFIIVDLYLDHNEKGTDFIDEIKNFFIPIIICTSYPQQVNVGIALEAGVEAVISKPIDKSALTFQIKKIVKEINESRDKENYLIIRDKGSRIKLPTKNIFSIQIDGNYSFIFLESSKRYVIKESLKKLMEKLDPKIFVRCHRSTIVNLAHVDSISSSENKIILTNNTKLDLARRYRKEIQEKFGTT